MSPLRPRDPPLSSAATPSAIPFVRLRRKLGRTIHGGHPWIYRESLEEADLPHGTVVAVGEKGRPALGWGFWDATSAIAVRLVSRTRLADVPSWMATRLGEVLQRRQPLVTNPGTDTFRLVHGEADGMAGVHVDLYGAFASVRYDGEGARAFYGERLAETLTTILPQVLRGPSLQPLRGVMERKRGARADSQGAPEAARLLWGEAPSDPVLVHENGVRFVVDLVHGQKGGLFLDQRENRERIRACAARADVLNLFGYTGGFSLYAALGGARHTTTVDLSAGAINTAGLNFRSNGLPIGDAELVAEDAFAFLEEARRAKRQWDIVISDPPSFAPSQKALPRALAAYTHLHALASSVVKPGGLFCAASCSSHVQGPAFLVTVHQGVERTGRRWQKETLYGAGLDHPVAPFFPEGAYLKFAMGTMEGELRGDQWGDKRGDMKKRGDKSGDMKGSSRRPSFRAPDAAASPRTEKPRPSRGRPR